MNYNILYKQILLIVSFFFFWTYAFAQENAIEEVFVTAEKRSESVQDISQAVTAISSDEIESKNITSFVDLSAIVPGVTVAKNEGYKTVISIRGVGNETNQNAIAAPSVAFHMDGIFIASPFSLQTDFIDVDRIEVLRGPQGTLFGQNSTGGVINVVSKKPSMEGYFGKSDITFGNYGLTKFRSSNNFVVSDSTAARFSISTTDRDGFSDNLVTGQDLDDDSNISLRADFLIDLGDNSSLRFFGQYFDVDRNGSAMKGIDDPTPNPRDLRQDSVSNHELTSSVFAAIYENDLGFANLKIMASVQEDDISVTRDNDRHNYGDPMITIPGFPADATYQRAEFRPETSLVDTTTFEINLVSNFDGPLNFTVGLYSYDSRSHNRFQVQTASWGMAGDFSLHPYSKLIGNGMFDAYGGLDFYQTLILGGLSGSSTCALGGTPTGNFVGIPPAAAGPPASTLNPSCLGFLLAAGGVYPFHVPTNLSGYINDNHVRTKANAALGEIYYDLSEDTQLTVGFRYNEDTVMDNPMTCLWVQDCENYTDAQYASNIYKYFPTPVLVEDNAFAYKVAISHDINEGVMVYGNIATAVTADGISEKVALRSLLLGIFLLLMDWVICC